MVTSNTNQKDDNAEKTSNHRGLWKPIVLIGAVVAVLVLANIYGLGDWLGNIREWVLSSGVWGPLVYVLLYIVAVVAAFPGSVVTIMGGALFGSVLAIILVSFASTMGASLSFLIARYFARGPVERWLAKNEKFQQLDRLTEKHGAIIVAIIRLVPLFPFNLVNYGLGLTKVRFATYVFWSWLPDFESLNSLEV